jgi:hypothetical protein
MTLLTEATDVFAAAERSGCCLVAFAAKRQPLASGVFGTDHARRLKTLLQALQAEGWLMSARAMFEPNARAEPTVFDTGFAHDADLVGAFEAPSLSAALAGTVRLGGRNRDLDSLRPSEARGPLLDQRSGSHRSVDRSPPAGALGKVVAYHAAAAEVAALKNGAIHVLIAQDPKQEGEVAMESAAKLIKGDKLGKTTLTEIVTIKAGDTATRRQVRIQRRLRSSVWRTPLCSGEAASLIFVEKAARESADL